MCSLSFLPPDACSVWKIPAEHTGLALVEKIIEVVTCHVLPTDLLNLFRQMKLDPIDPTALLESVK
jgi:hypothetical protein